MTLRETVLEKGKKLWKPCFTWAFFGTFFTGLICHMPAMTHNLPTYDTFWNIYSNQDMISSGRQFLTFACGGSSFYNLPWINGLLALFFLSLTAVVFVALFHIDKPFPALLAGAVLATFPAITGTFVFIYTIDGYMVGLLLSVLAVLLAEKKKYGFIAGIFLLGVAIGIYQSYFSVAILTCMFLLIQRILDNKGSLKGFFSKVWRYLAMGIGAYAFYVLSLKIMLALSGQTLSGYQGTDKVGGLSLSALPAGIRSAYVDFVKFTLPGGVLGENIWMKAAYCLFALLCIGLFVYALIQSKTVKKAGAMVLILALICMMPLGASLICIISPDVFFHVLMRMPWAVFFVYGLSLFSYLSRDEKSEKADKKETPGVILTLAGSLFLVCLIYNFILSANVVYFNLNERYEKTYAMCERIVDRLEQTEGYRHTDAVAILGGFPNMEYYPSTEITGKITEGYHGAAGDYCVESAEKYGEFMKHYLNVSITVPPFEDQIEITKTQEFIDMPCFPKKESIRKIHGVWVIKLNG